MPKIGEYLGKKEELIFPEVSTTVSLAEDCKTATITINAKEKANGISKIEILQGGYILETYTYENKKELIIENYIAKYNGTYVIKVYANFTVKEKAEVEGIVSSVEYTPNGDSEYKKQHQVKVSVEEREDKVRNIKYQWLQTTVEPAPETFTNTCNNNEVITGRDFTGIYYLWTLLEMQSGKMNISRSEEFHFDNEGPNVTLNVTPTSEKSFTLSVEANDEYSELSACKFYVNGILKKTQDIKNGTTNYTTTVSNMGNNYECYVIVTDSLGNENKQTITARTKMHTWEKFGCKEQSNYSVDYTGNTTTFYLGKDNTMGSSNLYKANFDKSNGKFTALNKLQCVKIIIGTSNSFGLERSKISSGDYVIDNTTKVAYEFQGAYYYTEKPDYWSEFELRELGTPYYDPIYVIDEENSYGLEYTTSASSYENNKKNGEYWYIYKNLQ